MTTSTNRTLGLAVAATACLLMPIFAAAAMHATKEFEDGATRPATIALLPAQVELVMQRIMRQETQVEEGGELEGHLLSAVAAEFETRGYEVVVLTAERINSDPLLQEAVVNADRRFAELYDQVESKLKRHVKRRRYNAGAEAQILAAQLGVDAVAFTRMQLVAAAKGLQVLKMGMGGTETMLTVTVIDGSTSDIEAYFTLPILRRAKVVGGGYEDIMNDPDVEMARYARLTLDDLPDADPAARVAASEDDVLADIEALLEE